MAAAELGSLPQGSNAGPHTIPNASRAMEHLLFRLGSLEIIDKALRSFFARPAVRVAMSTHLNSRTDSVDDSTIDEVIRMAKGFFTGVMATKGRRTDIDMNAFWAAAAAVVPVSTKKDRKARSVMRVLGLRHDSVKHATEDRGAMADSAAGWRWIKTKQHCDRLDWSPLEKWLHSDEAPTPDNDHKTEIKVNTIDSGGVVSYELHKRHYWVDKHQDLRERFRTTPSYADMNQRHIASVTAPRLTKATHAAKSKHGSSPSSEHVQIEFDSIVTKYKERASWRLAMRRLRKKGLLREATADEANVEAVGLPDVGDLVVGKKQFAWSLRGCTFHRKGGECDCPDCTYVTHNAMRLRRDMVHWHAAGRHKKCSEGCMSGAFRIALTKTLQSVSDYAAQPTLLRGFTPTRNPKQKMNNCVALLSFKPHEANRFIQTRGKCEARVVSGVRSRCIVVCGIFDPAIKPSAQQYNMQRLDCEMFLKFGFTVYGEWFVNRKRIPKYKRRAPSDEDTTADEPATDGARWAATEGKRVLMYFPEFDGHYGGIVGRYDKDKDGGYHYRAVYGDGDESDCTWREIQPGLIWGQTGGFVAGEHDDPLPTGPIGSAGNSGRWRRRRRSCGRSSPSSRATANRPMELADSSRARRTTARSGAGLLVQARSAGTRSSTS